MKAKPKQEIHALTGYEGELIEALLMVLELLEALGQYEQPSEIVSHARRVLNRSEGKYFS